jgi:hypothetical protein
VGRKQVNPYIYFLIKQVQPTALITSGFNTPDAFQPQGAIISGNKLGSLHIKYVTHFVTKYSHKYTLQFKI